MNLSQMELLLNQLYECSIAIHSAIEKGDAQEIDNLIEIKNEKLNLIELNKKFVENTPEFLDKIKQIQEQEKVNLAYLNEKKDEIYKQYKSVQVSSKVIQKYAQNNGLNGSIVDVRE